MSTYETAPVPDFNALAQENMGRGGLFVYDSRVLEQSACEMLDLDLPYGLTVRYAAKANPHAEIIEQFDVLGLHFDASSSAEAKLLIDNGVEGSKISLSSQVLDDVHELEAVLSAGVLPVATSHYQLELLGSLGVKEVAIRVNPGVGSGGNNRTNVGGSASSFGIWHEQLEEIKSIAQEQDITINRLHTHIGSGADPAIWRVTMQKSLGIVEQLPDVICLDVGGGYKVARMQNEKTTDMHEVADVFSDELEKFYARTNRRIALEIEPGTALVALAGTLLCRVQDVVRTDMYRFIKLNAGMNALIRPSLYGAQHPIEVLNNNDQTDDFVVVGPCCESGDILTPAPNDPEGILPRTLKIPSIGDIVAIGGAGAYGPTMAASGYNRVPKPTELYI